MVKVWFCFDGPKVTRGGPAYELTVDECERKLGLTQGGLLTDLSTFPKFNVRSKVGEIAGYKYVVAEVGEDEAAPASLLAGYYYLQLDPEEVIESMGRQPAQPVP